MHSIKTALLTFTSTLVIVGTALAGHPVTTTVNTEETWSAFAKGNTELEVGVGPFWGMDTTGTAERPDFGFGLGTVRYGWMLSEPRGYGILRGNCEFLIGAFGAGIFDGPGSFIVGADLHLRYNFVQPNATIVPYLQITGGGAYSDAASDDRVQRLLGSDWSFELGASIGVRWMLSKRMALTTAFEWRHLSNADTADRNRGYNALGGVIGLAWLY